MKILSISRGLFRFNSMLALVTFAEVAGADPLDIWTLSSQLPPQVGLSAIAYAQGQFVAVGWPGAILTSADGVNWIQRQANVLDTTNCELHGIAYGNSQFVAVGETSKVGGNIVLGETGTIVTSTDGVNWVQVQSMKQTQLTSIVYGNGQFVAVNDFDTTMLTSADGANWEQRLPSSQAWTNGYAGLYGLAYGDGRFVAVGRAEENGLDKGDVLSFPIILTSADSVNWVSQVLGTLPYTGLNAVTYGNGQFVAVGAGYEPDLQEAFTAIILTSTDGTNWVERQSTTNNGLHDAGLHSVTYASGQFVTVGRRGDILTSHDGTTWVQRPSPTEDSLTGIAYGNGHFVGVGSNPTVLESGSIITLTIAPSTDKGLVTLSLEGPIGLNYTVQSSTNLISWRNLTNIISAQPTNITFDALPSDANHVFFRAYSQ
jgi:hypothetical protein